MNLISLVPVYALWCISNIIEQSIVKHVLFHVLTCFCYFLVILIAVKCELMYLNLTCLLTSCGINLIYFIPRMSKINLHNCTVLWLHIDVSVHIFFYLCYVMPLSDMCVYVASV